MKTDTGIVESLTNCSIHANYLDSSKSLISVVVYIDGRYIVHGVGIEEVGIRYLEFLRESGDNWQEGPIPKVPRRVLAMNFVDHTKLQRIPGFLKSAGASLNPKKPNPASTKVLERQFDAHGFGSVLHDFEMSNNFPPEQLFGKYSEFGRDDPTDGISECDLFVMIMTQMLHMPVDGDNNPIMFDTTPFNEEMFNHACMDTSPGLQTEGCKQVGTKKEDGLVAGMTLFNEAMTQQGSMRTQKIGLKSESLEANHKREARGKCPKCCRLIHGSSTADWLCEKCVWGGPILCDKNPFLGSWNSKGYDADASYVFIASAAQHLYRIGLTDEEVWAIIENEGWEISDYVSYDMNCAVALKLIPYIVDTWWVDWGADHFVSMVQNMASHIWPAVHIDGDLFIICAMLMASGILRTLQLNSKVNLMLRDLFVQNALRFLEKLSHSDWFQPDEEFDMEDCNRMQNTMVQGDDRQALMHRLVGAYKKLCERFGMKLTLGTSKKGEFCHREFGEDGKMKMCSKRIMGKIGAKRYADPQTLAQSCLSAMSETDDTAVLNCLRDVVIDAIKEQGFTPSKREFGEEKYAQYGFGIMSEEVLKMHRTETWKVYNCVVEMALAERGISQKTARTIGRY